MFILGTVLLVAAFAGWLILLMLRVHRANQKIMRMLRDAFDSSDIEMPAQRWAEAMPSPTWQPGKTREAAATANDDAEPVRTEASRHRPAS
jgi:hypothetical protein